MSFAQGREPFSSQNSARDGETSGRQTETEQAVSAPPTLEIDQVAREKALGWATGLELSIATTNQRLDMLKGFAGDDVPLMSAVLGAIESNVEEIREQLLPLKQAILDIPLMEKGGRSS